MAYAEFIERHKTILIPELSNKEPLLEAPGHRHYSIFENDPDRTSELIKSMKLTDHKKRTCYHSSYRSPEVTLEFDYSTWADIYALGCLLYQLTSLSTLLPENLDDLQKSLRKICNYLQID